MVFWQLFCAIDVHSPLLLHRSLMMHINIPFKYTLKCPLIVDNDNSQNSRSLQSTLVFAVRFTQMAALVIKMADSCITTQLIVYQPVNGPLWVSECGMKSVLHMRSLAKIERWEAEYVYTYMRVAYVLFRSSLRHQMAQVAIRAEVAPVWVVVHPCLCASSVSVDFCGAILARNAAVRLIFANHCRVSFDRSLHIVVPGKLDTPLLLFSDFGARFLD